MSKKTVPYGGVKCRSVCIGGAVTNLCKKQILVSVCSIGVVHINYQICLQNTGFECMEEFGC